MPAGNLHEGKAFVIMKVEQTLLRRRQPRHRFAQNLGAAFTIEIVLEARLDPDEARIDAIQIRTPGLDQVGPTPVIAHGVAHHLGKKRARKLHMARPLKRVQGAEVRFLQEVFIEYRISRARQRLADQFTHIACTKHFLVTLFRHARLWLT